MTIFSIPETMIWPLLAALILTGIHVYLGIHVIGRKVIFVDLAMAQIAALGAAVGVLMGYEIQHSPLGVFGYSLAFTLFAALVFSITKMKSEEIPHEAIIGITYAVAVAAALIVLARSPLGPTEFDRMMKGELLYVTPGKVGITAAIYACIAVVHVLFRKQFFLLSFHEGQGLRFPRLWDFLFYATFGFVVTSSVSIAGVFLVFCLLVIPSVASFVFSKKTAIRLAIGWIGGAFLCLVGVKVSYATGWPTSPVIVVAFAVALVVAGIVKFVMVSPSKRDALLKLAGFSAVFTLFGLSLWLFRHHEEDPFDKALHFAHSENEIERELALDAFHARSDRRAEWIPWALRMLADSKAELRIKAMDLLIDVQETSAYPQIVRLLGDKDGAVQEHCLNRIQELGLPDAAGELMRASGKTSPDLRVKMLTAAMEFGEKAAVDALLEMLADAEFPTKWKRKAADALVSHVEGFPYPLDPDLLQKHPEYLEADRAWWRANRQRMTWSEHRFRAN